MQCSAVLGFLFVICLPITAEPVGSSPEDKKAQYPAVAASFKPVREEAIVQLADFVKHGDALLKERLQASYTDLKEQLKQGDSLLKDRMMEAVDHLKEQRKDGDSRLKEELDEDVEWLKGRVQEGKDRMKEDLEEAKKTFTGEMSDLEEALAKLQDSVQVQSSSAVAQEPQLQAELNTSRRADVDNAIRQLVTTASELNDTRQLLDDTRQQLDDTRQQLDDTRQQLDDTRQQMKDARREMNDTRREMNDTRREMDDTRREMDDTRQEQESRLDKVDMQLEGAMAELDSLNTTVQLIKTTRGQLTAGSTFTRWGSNSCPNNTTTVYTGVAGGSLYDHYGGGSNYLCLTMEPELRDVYGGSRVSYTNYLSGVEYEDFRGRQHQDAVCAVCRAPLATTIMVPATRTCPTGWTAQYQGTLMSAEDDNEGRTEFVCVDDAMQYRAGGSPDQDGSAHLYRVVANCDSSSLPCTPYVHGKVVTCVVCSV